MKKQSLVLLLLLLGTSVVSANEALPNVETFIKSMHEKHGFNEEKLTHLFDRVEVKDSILKAISRPAEKSKPWYDYRDIFIIDKRISRGAMFWKENKQALSDAEKEYGVPAEIIVAILGVETWYGGNVGSYRVIDALSTLAFRYPPRSAFFTKELENFLLLTREENMSMLTPVGSYAGAMGLGQFMPSSYRAYAVDFDKDGHRDIWTNPTDAIGSIANYLKLHGWVKGKSIAHMTTANDAEVKELVEKGMKPSLTREQLANKGVSLTDVPQGDDPLALIALTQKQGEEYWVVRQNFYAITRYNHSRMYAMAVKQLADLIRQQYEQP